jgi:hypothetical protein
MMGPGGLIAHPLWRQLAPAIIVEAGTLLATGRKHRRLELPLQGFEPATVGAILDLRVPCAACGNPIQPFRTRKRGSAGRAERPGRVFLALTCTLDERVGCSRGNAASAAYEQVIRHLDALKRKPVQLGLFGGSK